MSAPERIQAMSVTAEQARDRVMAYLRRRKLDRQVEQAVVHTYDASPDGEVSLRVDDLHTVIAQAEENARLRAKLEKAVEAFREAYSHQLAACAEWEAEMAKARGVKKRMMLAARYAGHRSAMQDLAKRISMLKEIPHD